MKNIKRQENYLYLLKMKIINFKTFILFLSCILIHSPSFSDNSSTVDSLLKVLGKTKEDTTRLRTYINLCKACDTKDNLLYAEPALKLANKLLSQTIDLKSKKNIANQKAALYVYFKTFYYEYRQNSEFILSFCKELLLNYQSLNDTIGIITTKLQISFYYLERYDAPKAMEYCQQALLLSEKIRYVKGMAKCLAAKSRLFKEQGNFQEALVVIEQALNKFYELKDTEREAYTTKEKGVIYGELNNMKEAVACYEKAIQLYKEMDSKEGLRAAYNQLGLLYYNHHNLDSALINYNIALDYADQLPDKSWMRGILGNIGEVYRDLGNPLRAIEYHTKAMNSIKELKMETQEAFVNWHFAQDYVQLKNYNKAKKFNDSYLDVMKRLGLKEEICESEKLAAEIDSAMGNFKGAYLHHQQYMFLRDQLNSEEIKKQAVKEKYQTEYDEQKKRDLMMQNQKDAIALQQIQKQKILRNSFIAGSILLLLLIVVLINRNKLKRSMEMEKMRSRLSRDLHDDIGSTLSSINILSRTAQSNLAQTNEDKTKASLEKINERSQRLLDSMSDIIWNINPGNDTIEEVMSRMREYATTVLEAKNIDYTFNFPKEKMDCTLTMEVKNNMYLIFKEAINNLSKYSGATTANFSLTFDEKSIHLKIEDNGNGFEIITNESGVFSSPLGRSGGAGLRNMQHRAEEVKGALKINSVPGDGTVIELKMPRYC